MQIEIDFDDLCVLYLAVSHYMTYSQRNFQRVQRRGNYYSDDDIDYAMQYAKAEHIYFVAQDLYMLLSSKLADRLLREEINDLFEDQGRYLAQ